MPRLRPSIGGAMLNVILRNGKPIYAVAGDEETEEALFYLNDPTLEVVEVPLGIDLGPVKAGYRVWFGLVGNAGEVVLGPVERTVLELFFRQGWTKVPTGWITHITAKTEEEAMAEFERRRCLLNA
jgi:hypothetical protein